MTPIVRGGLAGRLAQLIAIPTVSDPGEEPGVRRDRFLAFLHEAYPLTMAVCELENVKRTGVLLRWAALTPSPEDPLVLMAHYDVVPASAEDGWTHSPFAGVVADGWVYGRGALDDKGPLVVILEAIENLLASGIRLNRDVYASFGGDEETTGEGARAISDLLNERGVTPWLVVDEGGAVIDPILPGTTGHAAVVGIAEKGTALIRLSVTGEPGHASTPPSRTSIGRLARAVHRIEARPLPTRMPRAVAELLWTLSGSARPVYRLAYRLLAAVPAVGARILAHRGGEVAAMMRTTVAPTQVQGGSAPNVLPAEATATLNVRLAPGDSIDAVITLLRRRIRDDLVRVDVIRAEPASPESPTDDDRFAALAQAVSHSHPEATMVPYLMMAATDSRHFHRYFSHVYRFAPLGMSRQQRAGIHGVDERVAVVELERGELFHRTLILTSSTVL